MLLHKGNISTIPRGIKMKEKRNISTIFFYAATTVVVLLASYLALVFPADFVLDLFWGQTGQQEIQNSEYDYGQFAGLPAGDGIPELSDIEQYNNATSLEYYTFCTESIIPLDAYRLKSESDATDTSYRSGRRSVSSGVRQWSTYSEKAGFKRFLFNRYYLVQLPDGNYAAALLDDGYYLRYCLTGTVQLPIGRVGYMETKEKELLAPYIEAYGLNQEKILLMFSQERYEQHKTLNYFILAAIWIIVLAAYVLLITLAEMILNTIKNRRFH